MCNTLEGTKNIKVLGYKDEGGTKNQRGFANVCQHLRPRTSVELNGPGLAGGGLQTICHSLRFYTEISGGRQMEKCSNKNIKSGCQHF